MPDIGSALYLKVGAHSSTSDFSATPAGSAPNALVDMLPEKFDGFGSPSTRKLARNPSHPLNKRFPALRGPLDLSKAIPLEFIMRGLNGNTGAAITSTAKNDLIASGILQALFGAAPIDPAGAAATASAGVGATPTLTVSEQARFPPGSLVTFTTDAQTLPFVRQVVSRAASSGSGDLTLDRAYTGTVTNGQTVGRGTRFFVDPSIHQHTHVFMRAEWENMRRDFKGGMSLGQFDYAVGEYGRLMSSWMFTDASDVAEANPTFSEQTVGDAVVNVNNQLWLGNTPIYSDSHKVNLGGTMSPQKVNAGPQGIMGFRVAKGGGTPKPTISFRAPRGTGTGELADSTGTPSVNDLQGYSVAIGVGMPAIDLAFQVGNALGALNYWRAPAASCSKCEDVNVDGYQWLDLEFECDGPSVSGFGSLELLIG